MKTLMLFIIFIFTNILFLKAQDSFKIVGNAMGIPDGKVFLFRQHSNGVDTLAVSDMVQGTFTLKGKVPQSCVALVVIANQKGSIPVMLENKEFKIMIGISESFVEGGEYQQIYNGYSEYMWENSQELNKVMKELNLAASEQNQMKMNVLRNQMLKLRSEIMQKELEWIKLNSNHFVTAFIVYSELMQRLPYEEIKARYDLLGSDAKGSFYGEVLAAYVVQQEMVGVGAFAHDFTLKTPEGETISLKDIKSKVKLIDFWASWCNPCRQENRNMVSIYKKYHKKGLEIFSVSMDTDEEKWKKAIKEDGLCWYHGSDLKGREKSEVARFYMVMAIPYTILLDENNRIVAKNLRGEELRKKIAEILKE